MIKLKIAPICIIVAGTPSHPADVQRIAEIARLPAIVASTELNDPCQNHQDPQIRSSDSAVACNCREAIWHSDEIVRSKAQARTIKLLEVQALKPPVVLIKQACNGQHANAPMLDL